jgi:GntR family transcriptional regulator
LTDSHPSNPEIAGNGSELTGAGGVAYQALAEDLRGAIVGGEFSHGERMPTEAELAERYRVSRQTVRRAMQDLVAEGLIFRVRGRGTFASPLVSRGQYVRSFGSIEDLLALSVDTTMALVEPFDRRADISAASRMGLESDQIFTALIQRFHDDNPFCITEVFLPVEVGRLVLDSGELARVGTRTPKTVISIIDRVWRNGISGAHQSITACAMPDQWAALIDCTPGQPVLRVDRLYVDSDGRSLELGISYFNPLRYSYRLELRRNPRSPGAARPALTVS